MDAQNKGTTSRPRITLLIGFNFLVLCGRLNDYSSFSVDIKIVYFFIQKWLLLVRTVCACICSSVCATKKR